MGKMSKFFTILLMAATIVSCGKDNGSGSGAPAAASVVTASTAPTDWYVEKANDPDNSINYEKFRDFYKGKDLAHGLRDGSIIYHIGPAFEGSSLYNNFDSGFDFNFSFNLCYTNWSGELKGDCADNTYTSTNYLQDMISRGEYKIVRARNAERIDFDIAQGISGNIPTFDSYAYDRTDARFRAMLNLDAKPYTKVVISKATVQVQIIDVNNSQNTSTNIKSIRADYIEYFYPGKPVEGYIVSPELPFSSNPIGITQNHQFIGLLDIADKYKIRSVKVDAHGIQEEYYPSQQIKKYTLGPISYQL